MKKLVLMLGLVVCSVSAYTLTSIPPFEGNGVKAKFQWLLTSFDFGKIKRNVPVTHEFKFTNTGDAPLIITSVQASCGCTLAVQKIR